LLFLLVHTKQTEHLAEVVHRGDISHLLQAVGADIAVIDV
jgi:hypothetical protein